MIVDIHTHLVPEAYVRFVERAPAYAVRRSAPDGEAVTVTVGPLSFGLSRTFFDPERLLARMDDMGIDRAVLSLATPFVNYAVPTDLALEAAWLYNEEIAAVRHANPDRFEGWAFLPMQDPEAAAEELRRGVLELGLVGGYVGSNVDGRYLDRPEFAPLFDAAVELDAPLFIHPSNPSARERMRDHELAVVVGYLFDTTLNIFNMICGGLLDRYPMLRLCCTHAGGYAPMLRLRMQREIETNPALAERLTKPVGEYLGQLYYDTVCFEPGYVQFLAGEVIDPTHLLLGSDSPFPLGEPDPVGFIRRSFSGDPAVEKLILDRNAADFLRLE